MFVEPTLGQIQKRRVAGQIAERYAHVIMAMKAGTECASDRHVAATPQQRADQSHAARTPHWHEQHALGCPQCSTRALRQDGFAAITIRRVDADALVDVSQVMQFFGSKSELFAAVIHIPTEAFEGLATFFEVRGGQWASAWCALSSTPRMATQRGTVINEQACEQLRDFIQSQLLEGFRKELSPDATLRAGLASALLVGVIVSRRIIGALTGGGADRGAGSDYRAGYPG